MGAGASSNGEEQVAVSIGELKMEILAQPLEKFSESVVALQEPANMKALQEHPELQWQVMTLCNEYKSVRSDTIASAQALKSFCESSKDVESGVLGDFLMLADGDGDAEDLKESCEFLLQQVQRVKAKFEMSKAKFEVVQGMAKVAHVLAQEYEAAQRLKFDKQEAHFKQLENHQRELSQKKSEAERQKLAIEEEQGQLDAHKASAENMSNQLLVDMENLQAKREAAAARERQVQASIREKNRSAQEAKESSDTASSSAWWSGVAGVVGAGLCCTGVGAWVGAPLLAAGACGAVTGAVYSNSYAETAKELGDESHRLSQVQQGINAEISQNAAKQATAQAEVVACQRKIADCDTKRTHAIIEMLKLKAEVEQAEGALAVAKSHTEACKQDLVAIRNNTGKVVTVASVLGAVQDMIQNQIDALQGIVEELTSVEASGGRAKQVLAKWRSNSLHKKKLFNVVADIAKKLVDIEKHCDDFLTAEDTARDRLING